MKSITEAVLAYQQEGKGYDDLVNRISVIIYNFPEKIQNLTEEDKCEFYLSFHSRIRGLICNFSFRGIPFEALLNQSLKWHTKTYISKKREEKKRMTIQVKEAEVLIKEKNASCLFDVYEDSPDIKLKSEASRKRLLFLILVDSPNITDREMKAFSEMSCYEYDWLLSLKDTLNKNLYERSQRLTMLRGKRNNIYMQILYKQTRYSEEIEDEKKKRIKDQIGRLRKRLEDIRKEISRVPSRPTHREVAGLLNIPKGTIDSGLHYFRKKYKSPLAIDSYSQFF